MLQCIALNSKMDLQCEYCGRTFPTNASLYMHKQTHTPSLVLVNHNHDGNTDNGKPDPQLDPGLQIIDDYKFVPGTKKRYRDSTDSRIPLPGKKRKPDPQLDPGLQIIDQYPKPDDNDVDDDFTIVDEYIDDGYTDGHLDGPKIVDGYSDGNIKLDYKTMYEQCIKDSKRLRYKFNKHLEVIDRKHRANVRRGIKDAQDQLSAKYEFEIAKLKRFHDKQMSHLETLKDVDCADKIQDEQNKCQDEINKLKAKHIKQLEDLEEECNEKLRLLNDQIKALQEDDDNLSSLAKAIFNCTTMEEIFEIQRLVKNHQIDQVVQNHLPTLQNLFLSLSYGVLPICQPQRDRVTDSQRRLVERIQTSSRTSAKRLIKENRNDVVNLFTIIHDSLKLARNTYNRYGTTTVNTGV